MLLSPHHPKRSFVGFSLICSGFVTALTSLHIFTVLSRVVHSRVYLTITLPLQLVMLLLSKGSVLTTVAEYRGLLEIYRGCSAGSSL